jgi:hypothetical protein
MNITTTQQWLVALWGILAIIAGAAAISACCALWHGFHMDRGSGQWKGEIWKGAMTFLAIPFVGLCMFKLWGVAAPALNWN